MTLKYPMLIILLAANAGVAQQPGRFTFENVAGRNDKNKDGVIDKEEFRGNPGLFDRIDANKDGKITEEEFDESVKQTGKYRQQRRSGMRKAPEGVIVHRNLEYAVEDGQSLQLDLYLPQTSSNTPPLMVWIHGGGWKNGDKANINPAILRLSADGYAVASINYRLKDLTIHPKNIHDCKGAVRWLRAHAGEYGYDPERLAVGGSSAGGHLALLLGLSSGFDELEGTVGGNTNQSSAVSAIVDLYGPSELEVFAQNNARFNETHDFYETQLKHASPLTYLTKDDPPVLIFHGDKDKTVPLAQSQLVDKRYQEMGLESHLYIQKGAGHGGAVFGDEIRYEQIKSFLDRYLQIN